MVGPSKQSPSASSVDGGATRILLSLALAGLAGGVGVAIALTWDPGPESVDALVVQAVRLAGLAGCAWYAVAALVSTVTLLVEGAGGTWTAGRRLLVRWAPRLVARVAGAGAAAGLSVAALVAPSTASVPENLTAPPVRVTEEAPGSVPVAGETPTPVTTAGRHGLDHPEPRLPVGDPTERPTDGPQESSLAAETPVPEVATKAPSDADADTHTGTDTGTAADAAASHDPGSAPEASPAAPRPLKASATASPAPTTSTTAPTAVPGASVLGTQDVPAESAPAEHRPPAPTTYTVRPGDSLWHIAREFAGTAAAGAEATWQDWYATNAGVIGGDPDLIHPGTVLTVPGVTEGGPADDADPSSPPLTSPSPTFPTPSTNPTEPQE